MEEPYINPSQRTDDLVEKFKNLPDKILLDNFNKISPERRKQIKDDYINMCMNRKDDNYILFPVDKIFKNLPDFLSVKRLNNVNYMKPLGNYIDSFYLSDGVDFTRYDLENLRAFYREYNEDDLLLIEVFKLFLPGYVNWPEKRVELDKNGKGIKILKFKSTDEFSIYCAKQGGIYSVRDKDCIPIEELRGRQAIVILKDKNDDNDENRNYTTSFKNIEDDVNDISSPYSISYKFIDKVTTKSKSKPKPVLKRVMRF